ncbi:MAG TPA: M1 family aminopeptidase, partial [Bryobacteraceae bacterium]|nr:M1 family aminopeptidase [Bryobacteraceae bacterium]
ITAEVNPSASTISAVVQVRFAPLEDSLSSVEFELHNALDVSKITDSSGQQIPASRSPQDAGIRVNLPSPVAKGQAVTLTFHYDGTLRGREESLVPGVRFAAIHSDFSYLLYPSRWFPVNGYTTDRYTYELKLTVPDPNRVIASGLEKKEPAGEGKSTYNFTTLRPAFPGSIAIVAGDPVEVPSEGVTTRVFFRGEAAGEAAAYGQETGRIMTYFSGLYGAAPRANLALVQTEDGAPNGYATEGILFLAPRSIGKQVNTRVLSNQIARQWWGVLVSPSTRDHLWLTNGAARYSELLYIEHTAGAAAMQAEVQDTYVEALTVDSPPLIQTSRLEDYSPEFWALTAGKGAAVYNMLRLVMGDEGLTKLVREFPDKYAWQSVNTGDFRRAAEGIFGSDLQWFFIEWIESTGAPEFRLEYTIFRTQKNFRIVGKVTQDMDTFRMPVDLKIETDGNPERKRVEVVGTSSEFSVETFGRPRNLILDPDNRLLRYSSSVRVAVAIRRGEMFVEAGNFTDALREYQRALDVNRASSLANYRVGEVWLLQDNYQSAANAFREALNGDLQPRWVEVWAHINLGKIFDITGQRERARNEFQLAIRTKDNTQGAQEEAAKYIDKAYQRPARPDR